MNAARNLRLLLPRFREMVAAKPPSSAPAYRKGLRCLSEYLDTLGLEDGEPEKEATPSDMRRVLSGWMLDMYLRGLSAKTSLHFLDIISGLYSAAVREGLVKPTEVFRQVKSRAKEAMDSEPCLAAETYDTVVALARRAGRGGRNMTARMSVGADMLLLSLSAGTRPPVEILNLKRSDMADMDETSAAILARHVSPRRRYVFDARPYPATPRALEIRADALLRPLMARAGVAATCRPQDVIESVWAHAALRCGVAPEDVPGILGKVPSGLPLLRLFRPSEITSERRRSIAETVAPVFTDDPVRWYAMRLRPRVTYAELVERLDSLKGDLAVPVLFYPSEEIARRTGKRLVFESRPVIRDVVFFRSRPTDILPLFSRIGDIAWCYTTTGRPGAPYAPISRRAFRQFQETIGSFTPDYEVAPLGTLTPREGERVVMVGGIFQGQEANVDRVAHHEGGPVIYRLQFHSSNGIEWRVETNRVEKI